MRKVVIYLMFAAALMPAQSDHHKVTKADIDRWMTELSNWGRWGQDDQLGALNLITPAKRRDAVALVREGYTISMAHNVLTENVVDNEDPFVHTMLPSYRGSRGTRTGGCYEEALGFSIHCLSLAVPGGTGSPINPIATY